MLSNRTGAVLDGCLTFVHPFVHRFVHRSVQRGWPLACVLCGSRLRPGEASGTARFCAPCAASLPRLADERCEICALPLTSGRICGACLTEPPAYDAVCVPHAYAFPVDALIHAYKYGGDLSLARVLAASLASAVRTRADVLIPMPLAPARLRERGFNQAHEIARHLGRALGIEVLPEGARKVADTPPQAALPWKARARNVRGAFVCDADLSGRHVAIVDDVMTTGATLNELARNLKRAGAVRVSGWVLARTLRAAAGEA